MYIRARKRGLNISEIANQGLKAALGLDHDKGPDAVMAAALEAQDATVTEAVRAESERIRVETKESLDDLQRAYNLYLSTGPKPPEAKLEWVNERKRRFTALAGWSGEVLLSNLEPGPA